MFHEESDLVIRVEPHLRRPGRRGLRSASVFPVWPVVGPLERTGLWIRFRESYWLVTVSSFQGSGAAGTVPAVLTRGDTLLVPHPAVNDLFEGFPADGRSPFRTPGDEDASVTRGGIRQAVEPPSSMAAHPFQLRLATMVLFKTAAPVSVVPSEAASARLPPDYNTRKDIPTFPSRDFLPRHATAQTRAV